MIALLLTACIELPLVYSCTEEGRVSVTVRLLDEAGDPVLDPEVAFRPAGDDDWQPCMDWGDDSFACGFEVAGELEIRGDGWGFDAVTETVTVDEDECHVITQELDLTLPSVGCTAEVRPSLHVTVLDTDGSPVTDAAVVYAPLDLDLDAPLDCYAVGDHEFQCGEEEAGEIWVEASAPNRGSWSDTVVVDFDECHVITESVTAELMLLD